MSTEREAFEAARAEGHLWAYDDFCAGFEAGKQAALAGEAMSEGVEIIKNLIDNIEADGMYSKETTLGCLTQAYYALRPANPPLAALASAAAPVAQAVEASDAPAVMLPRIGAVPVSMANDPGILALQRMAQSIQVIDKIACWDHLAMFEVRDALCAAIASTPQAAPTSDAPSYHCIGYIEHYGTEIRDLPKGKQNVPVYVRANEYLARAQDRESGNGR